MAKTTKSAPLRGPRKAGPEATRQKILDAAEILFAERGFHSVSVRDITAAAGVDVALVHYHFGNKQLLFETVFMRRAELLNAERLRRLEAVVQRAKPRAPKVEEIIDAFTHPLLDRSARGGPGWKAYFALIAQVNNSTEFGGLMMTRYFDPVVHAFIAALRRAFPGCDERELYWSYHFLSGALTLTFAETGRIDNLSQGACRSNDLDSVHQRLVPYVAAGFRALCSRSSTTPARRKRKTL
ncbi:MAG: TetR/AcrR family transcriptional regulator [Gammaproteobacteria bacterium]|jgi:AcrR family transcriptional regulator|nr:TetR/AcrR family transcriptional regulator [Gammaproteobacteria bacterium]